MYRRKSENNFRKIKVFKCRLNGSNKYCHKNFHLLQNTWGNEV